MNNINPLVSIMIPVYNREGIIRETLECAINQTYKNLEIIVSDNCSTDGTWSVLEEYVKKDNRIKIFRNEVNLGPVLNWKKCIDKLEGEYTKILWSDDLISLDFVEKTIKLFDKETAFVMSGIRIFNSDDNSTLAVSKFQKKQVYCKDEYLKSLLWDNEEGFPVSPGCALFRTGDIKDAYFEQIPNSENLDFKRFGAGNDLLFFLITANKYRYVKSISEIASFFRSHPSSFTISNNLDLYYEYAKAFFVSNYFNSFSTNYKIKLYFYKKRNPEYRVLFVTFEAKLSSTSLMYFYLKMVILKIKNKLYFVK